MMLAFEDLVSRFQFFLSQKYNTLLCSRQKKEKVNGMIIFDKNIYESSIQRQSNNFIIYGTRYREINSLREVPLFVNSNESRVVQLADHIAYAVFRRYNAQDHTYYSVIERQFGQLPCDPKSYGLFHMTRGHDNCNYPACLNARSNH